MEIKLQSFLSDNISLAFRLHFIKKLQEVIEVGPETAECVSACEELKKKKKEVI